MKYLLFLPIALLACRKQAEPNKNPLSNTSWIGVNDSTKYYAFSDSFVRIGFVGVTTPYKVEGNTLLMEHYPQRTFKIKGDTLVIEQDNSAPSYLIKY